MIKTIFGLFGTILKLLAKGLKYSLKGVMWFFGNLDLLARDVKSNNQRQGKIVKKEEIL